MGAARGSPPRRSGRTAKRCAQSVQQEVAMRSGSWARATAVVAAALALPAVAGAQTTDFVFGGWSWRPTDPSSRPAGFGGAYVAVADSVRTVSVNPAGVALIPKAELALGSASRWAGFGYALRPSGAAPAPT